MIHAFLGIDTSRHLRLVRDLCPEGWSAALVTERAVIDATEKPVAEEILHGLLAQKVDLSAGEQTEAVVGTFWVHVFPVLDHLKTCLGSLVVFGQRGADLEGVFEPLHLLVEGLRSEVTLSNEISDMAEELNRRHEELNLIYNTNDQPEDDADDEEVLEGIVENVVDYLDADLALLSVPSRNVWVLQNNASVDAGGFQQMLEDSEQRTLEWLRRHRQPLVINNAEEASELGLLENLPFRVLVVPVTDDRDAVIGGLALCRSPENNRIVNSDKNLLNALSRRIGKIIQVSFDPLTGLPRRMKFERMMDRAISGLMSNREQHCLLHINIDGLSGINEQFGVRVGDAAIEVVASHIAGVSRSADVCGRIGGDEFSLLLMNCKQAVALKKAEELQVSLSKQPFLAGRTRQTLRVSIGVVSVGRGGTASEAMTKAGVACGIAKERGGDATQVYESAYEQVAQKMESVRLLSVVRQALESRDMFKLYAQPIVPLHDDDTPHFEVLLRLFDHNNQMIPPDEFIPVAEKHSLMPDIDRYVVRNAVELLASSGLVDQFPELVCSVNLSGQSFGDNSVLKDLQNILQQHQLPAENLCLEVTETAAIQDLGGAQYHINNARKLGCQFALDDFGAGLSSFTYLRALPLDYVKIDGSFVKDMPNDEIARTMVASIHNVGHAMGLKTVAEYVENDAIADELRELGIDFGQGFGLGKPEPMTGYLDRLRSTVARASNG